MQEKNSIIIPTFNEKDNLPILVFLLNEVFSELQKDFEIIIVDDNSQDGTGDIADTLKAYPSWKNRIKVLHRDSKLG